VNVEEIQRIKYVFGSIEAVVARNLNREAIRNKEVLSEGGQWPVKPSLAKNRGKFVVRIGWCKRPALAEA
jgi:hypothetical protein